MPGVEIGYNFFVQSTTGVIMQNDPKTIASIRAVLQQFQEGYTHRDTSKLDSFMDLFTPDADTEVIGTGAIDSNSDEWCIGPAMIRELVDNDWQYWGDLRIDVDGAHIHALGDVAWLAAGATVSMHLDTETEIKSTLDYFIKLIQEKEWSAKEKMYYIQRGTASVTYQMFLGEDFVWPLRFIALLVRRGDRWLFHQMHFSFPTTYFPHERILNRS
jgi:hypothetical protein